MGVFFRRYLFSILVLIILTAAFSGCTMPKPVFDDEEDNQLPMVVSTLPSRQPGELIKVSALESAYAVLCNNSGMSGAMMGRVHWHNNNIYDMYAGSKKDFIFDIGHIDQLGEFHIWNHNESGGSNGLKNITVSYSEDNANYTVLGAYILKRATGNAKLPVTNLDGDSFIDFDGKSARFIKISPGSNYGGGQWGLSQIRLFRYRPDVYKGSYITAAPIYNVRTTLPS